MSKQKFTVIKIEDGFAVRDNRRARDVKIFRGPGARQKATDFKKKLETANAKKS